MGAIINAFEDTVALGPTTSVSSTTISSASSASSHSSSFFKSKTSVHDPKVESAAAQNLIDIFTPLANEKNHSAVVRQVAQDEIIFESTESENNAAQKLQAQVRGNADRQKVEQIKE